MTNIEIMRKIDAIIKNIKAKKDIIINPQSMLNKKLLSEVK